MIIIIIIIVIVIVMIMIIVIADLRPSFDAKVGSSKEAAKQHTMHRCMCIYV